MALGRRIDRPDPCRVREPSGCRPGVPGAARVVEPICVESIAKVRETYFTTDLKERLAKYHAHVDDAFLGWADIWLAPEFRDGPSRT